MHETVHTGDEQKQDGGEALEFERAEIKRRRCSVKTVITTAMTRVQRER